MLKTTTRRHGNSLLALALGLALLCPSCSSTGAEGAAKGAAVGAAAGAVGGLLSAAIFGGDPVQAAGRGAAFGAGSGAVAGGIQGEQKHAAEQEKQRAQEEADRKAREKELRAEIGDDAYEGLVALVERKHEVALAYARTAAKAGKSDFAIAGLWLEALAYADGGSKAEAEALLPKIVGADSRIDSDAQAQRELDELLQGLADARKKYGV